MRKRLENNLGSRVRALTCYWLPLAVILLAASLIAQDNKRAVAGTVTDGNGVPISSAIVKIENTRSLQIRSFITQPDGKYRFFGLNPDVDYTLTAEYWGERSKVRTLSQFDSRRTATIDLTVELK